MDMTGVAPWLLLVVAGHSQATMLEGDILVQDGLVQSGGRLGAVLADPSRLLPGGLAATGQTRPAAQKAGNI